MKCSKCGAECKDSQKFCLNCGSQLRPDTMMDNGMEERLANSVGELLDEFDNEDDDDFEDFVLPLDESFFDDEPGRGADEEARRIHQGLQIDQIYAGGKRNRHEDEENEEDDWEYDEDKFFDDMQREREEEFSGEYEENAGDSPLRETKRQKKSPGKKQKDKKKMAVTAVVVVVILAICIGGGMYILNNIHFNLTTYDDYYGIASREFKRKDYKTSLKDVQSALRKAQRAYEAAGDDDDKKNKAKKQIVQARELIHDIYESTKKIDDEYADNMRAIVDMDPSKTEYFPKLAKYYSENKPPKVLTDFLRTVSDDNKKAVEALKKYIVPVPSSDKESGQYTEQFAVTLTCDEGNTIWYTLSGEDPSTHGVQYTEPIKIMNFRTLDDETIENGITVLKVITINPDGVESKVKEFEYEIVMASGEPIVTPNSGQYNDYTEIKVTVPQGSKCYYTIGEGSTKPADPDAGSTLYIASAEELPEGTSEEEKAKFKPLQIPRGTHIMKFVLIDEYGIVSDVAVRSYTLEIPRNVTLNDAQEMVREAYEEELATRDSTNIQEETTVPQGWENSVVSVKAEWEESVIIDEFEYYIIYAAEVREQGEAQMELSRMVYAVNSYDKRIVKDVQMENGAYVIPDEEDENAGEQETAAE